MGKRMIFCDMCGKPLFETQKEDGGAGVEAQDKGFVFKMPFLYGINKCVFFCNSDCHKAWSKENISEEAKQKGDKEIAEIKQRFESSKEHFIKSVSNFMNTINKERIE